MTSLLNFTLPAFSPFVDNYCTYFNSHLFDFFFFHEVFVTFRCLVILSWGTSSMLTYNVLGSKSWAWCASQLRTRDETKTPQNEYIPLYCYSHKPSASQEITVKFSQNNMLWRDIFHSCNPPAMGIREKGWSNEYLRIVFIYLVPSSVLMLFSYWPLSTNSLAIVISMGKVQEKLLTCLASQLSQAHSHSHDLTPAPATYTHMHTHQSMVMASCLPRRLSFFYFSDFPRVGLKEKASSPC